MKEKKYEIDTFEKLLNVVNKENFDRFTIDLLQWIHYYIQVIDGTKNKYPEVCKDKTNWEIAKGKFIWIDDGKNEMKSVKVTNTKTGEVKNFDIKHED